MVKPDREKIKKALDLRHEKLAAPEKFNWQIEPNIIEKLNAALITELNKNSTESVGLESSANYLEAIDKANKLTSQLRADNLYNEFAKILIIKTGDNNETYKHLVERYKPVESSEDSYAQLYNEIVSELPHLHLAIRPSELHQFLRQIVDNEELSDRMLAKQKLILKMASYIKSVQKENSLAKQISPYSMDYSDDFIIALIQELHNSYNIKKHEKLLSLYQEIYTFSFSSEINKQIEQLAIKLSDQVKEYTEMITIKEWIRQDTENVDAIKRMLEIRNLLTIKPYDHDLLTDFLGQLKLISGVTPRYRDTIRGKILISEIVRGDFFTTEQQERLDQLLPIISMTTPARDLISHLTENTENYNEDQAKEMLRFLKKYLDFDKQSKNIPYFYKDSLFVEPLIFLCQLLKNKYNENAEINQLVEEINDTIMQKILFKEASLNDLKNEEKLNKLTFWDIRRRLESLSQRLRDTSPDIAELEEIIFQLEALMSVPHIFSEHVSENTELSLIIDQMCEQISTKTLFAEKANSLLEQFMDRVHQQEMPKPSHLFDKTRINVVSLIESVAQTPHLDKTLETVANDLVENLNSVYEALYNSIDFEDLVLPQADSVKRYNQFHHDLVESLSELCLFHVESNGQLTVRDGLPRIKKIYHFFETATSIAHELGYRQTELALQKTIAHPSLIKLNLDHQPEAVSSDESIIDFYINGLQQIKRKPIKYLDKQAQIGNMINKFVAKQTDVRDLNLYDIINKQIQKILGQISPADLQKAVLNVKPVQIRDYQIDDFYTLLQLKDYLKYIYNRELDYHIDVSDPKKAIFDFIVNKIANDDELQHFGECIEILTLIDKIEEYQNREYKEKATHLEGILLPYRRKIALLLNEAPHNHIEAVRKFFNIYLKNPYIQQLKESLPEDKDSLLFSSKINRTMKKIDAFYNYFQKILENIEEEKSRQSYTALLHEVLEGKTHSVFADQKQEGPEGDSLLPETEYAPTEYETLYVGINSTMSFKSSQSQSPLDPFKTSNLISDFQLSFPWSLNIQNLDKLRTVGPDPELNLIGTTVALPGSIQVLVMQYLLISFDALGKVVGHDAELAMQNFSLIKKISTELSQFVKFVNTLQETTIDDEIKNKLRNHINEIESFNQTLYQNYADTHEIQVIYNEPINTFCHLNLKLVHLLMGEEYRKIPFAPSEPPASLSAVINAP